MSKSRKTKPVRNKQLARQKARAQRELENLLRSAPPFAPYQEWITLPRKGQGFSEYPFTPEQAAVIGQEAQDFLNRVMRLSPIYGGDMPMAALHLDMQITAGELLMAVTGEPDRVRPMPVAQLVENLSDQEFLDQLRAEHPEVGLSEEATELSPETCAAKIHELHARGYLVLDDNHVVNLAVPPTSPGGRWLLNGHVTTA
ncbi:hypothetical protein DI272_19175 [Streptomyces sp. Act143]|uniref:hypothetical protein n=1 Tax=Streptomyces sp. Act143 TaxID=2200760 RepID=UPI000D68188A|nr:hypothetical protein [Streptomyces sp. Act143]PWI16054.1 hypothetical protein DI272_19175 [Streptomyces sp. Act143]